jgi:hypothetical protein
MIICKILFGLIKAKYAVSLVGRWSCGKWDGPETVGCLMPEIRILSFLGFESQTC